MGSDKDTMGTALLWGSIALVVALLIWVGLDNTAETRAHYTAAQQAAHNAVVASAFLQGFEAGKAEGCAHLAPGMVRLDY